MVPTQSWTTNATTTSRKWSNDDRHVKPTQAERRQHRLTHTPYDEWCEHCMKSRGRDKPHRRVQHEEKDEAFVSFDYVSISEKDGSALPKGERSCISALVGYERWTQTPCCTAVQSKGADPHAVELVYRFLSNLGTAKIRPMCDQESSLNDLLRKVRIRLMREGYKVDLQHSPVGSPASNGAAEVAIKEVVGLAQTMYHQMLDTFRLRDVLPGHPTYSWLLRHAAWTLIRFRAINDDGDTSFKVRTGRHYHDHDLLEFGEVVMARIPLQAHTSRMQGRFVQATYAGEAEVSNEFVVSDMGGTVFTTRTVRRLPTPTRHSPVGIENVKLHPWQIRNRNAYPERDIILDLVEPFDGPQGGLPLPPPGQARQHEPDTPRHLPQAQPGAPTPTGPDGTTIPGPPGAPAPSTPGPTDDQGVRQVDDDGCDARDDAYDDMHDGRSSNNSRERRSRSRGRSSSPTPPPVVSGSADVPETAAPRGRTRGPQRRSAPVPTELARPQAKPRVERRGVVRDLDRRPDDDVNEDADSNPVKQQRRDVTNVTADEVIGLVHTEYGMTPEQVQEGREAELAMLDDF